MLDRFRGSLREMIVDPVRSLMTPTNRRIYRMRNWFAICLILVCSHASAINEEDLLPVEQAFAISTSGVDAGNLLISWDIAEGYYLYRGRISFRSETAGVTLGEAILPKGEEHEDEFFGHVETYRNRVTASIPYSQTDPTVSSINVQAGSQGCADLGVCYPPQRQQITIELPASAATNPLGLRTAGSDTLSFGASAGGLALGARDALPEDQAFKFEAIAMSATEILVRWTIADGYYLYRDKIRFSVASGASVKLGQPVLPAGVAKTDEHFGAVQVFYDLLEAPLPLTRLSSAADTLMLTGDYQGCKEAGICYPPITREIAVALPSYAGPLGNDSQRQTDRMPVPEQDRLARSLGEDSIWTLISFFGFGLLLAFTPCVFPMIPILSGIIAGQGDKITTARAFLLSVVYVLAMALTYTIAGVIAGVFGKNLQAAFQNTWMLAGFSAVFVLLSLSMFGFYELQLPASLQTRMNQISNRQSGGTWIGVAVMGVLSALIVGPCVAPPLAGALIYIGQSGDAVLGGLALFALSMGMGTPLIVVGTSAGKYLPRAGAWMDAVKAVFGVGLLALALWMLERILDPTLIMFLWGTLLIGSGIYLRALERLDPEVSGWRRLWKSIGVMLLVLGVLEFIGAAAGGKDWLQPLNSLRGGTAAQGSGQTVEFQTIKSVTDLDRSLASAGQPVVLDFSADWCVDCKRMEKYTFPTPTVQAELAKGVALQADVTANDDLDQELMRRFNIIGPPAILFFDARGQEMPGFRVVGYQRPEDFARHVKLAFETGN